MVWCGVISNRRLFVASSVGKRKRGEKNASVKRVQKSKRGGENGERRMEIDGGGRREGGGKGKKKLSINTG